MSEFKTPALIQLPVRKDKISSSSDSKDDVVSSADSKESKVEELVKPLPEKDLVQVVKQRHQKGPVDKDKYSAILATLKYREPLGAAEADSRYSLEVLKTGSIVDNVRFQDKRYFIVGRIPACDIIAENPTISRMHAILQFIDGSKSKSADQDKSKEGEDDVEVETQVREKGLYLYDLNSTHGTFLNKNRIYPNRFYRLRVGHVIKFGNSGRLYVVGGPEDDEEEEDERTITELQNERLAKELERKKLAEQMMMLEASPIENDVAEEGISWGMPEDAEEETDLRENPFSIDFESEKGFDDPKKTLRGWFEREGYELEYDVREKAVGHYICRVDLPLDGSEHGKIFAEVDVKGKKKEAVLQCALQACQILDKYGVLRQSHHESKGKRKLRDWEEQDYYSSDEDTFLDRTGSVETKRERRMREAGKIQQQTETFDSLREKHLNFQKEIESLKIKIEKAESKAAEADDDEVDPLDAFMTDLKTGSSDLKKLKTRLREVTAEQVKNKKLLDIATPALPPPVPFKPITSPRDAKADSVNSDTDVKTVSPDSNNSVTAETNAVSKKPSAIEKPLFGPRMQFKINSTKSSLPTSKIPFESEPVEEEKTKTSPTTTTEVNDDDDDNNEDEEDGSEKPHATVASKPKRKRIRQQPKKEVKIDYDAEDPNYSVWTPPVGQRGDGRTSLNDKLGY